MKLNLYLSLLLYLLLNNAVAAQQFPVRAQILVPRPIPTATVDLIGRAGDPLLVLTNNSLQQRRIMIGATITGDNGINGKVDPREKLPRVPITLQRLSSLTLSGDDLLAVFSNYSVFDVNLSGINIRSLIQNQLFPEGTYRLCAQVYDYETGQLLSAPGSSCSGPLTVRTPDPPIIIMPQQNERILGGEWQNIIFRWTPVNLPSTLPLYRIRIAEVPRGTNPYDAIDNDNLVRWVEEDMVKTSFLYDVSLPKLPSGEYVVQVTAYDANQQVAIKNEGRSDVVRFQISDQQPRPPRLTKPANRSEVPLLTPQAYLFTWLAPTGVQTSLTYHFRMVEIPSLAYARSMIDDPNALIYATETERTRLIFDEADPVLQLGQAYAWQVQVIDPSGEITFENDGFSDVYSFTVKEARLPAPEIIAPEEEEIIAANWPFSLTLDWDHAIPEATPVTYTVGVWALEDSDSPGWIIRETAPIISEEDLTATSFTTENTTLGEGGRFVARVIASSADDNVDFLNFGRSNLRIFEIEKTTTSHVLDLACGEGCSYELPNDTEAIGAFGGGDTVRMGNFLLRLTEATDQRNTIYSGTAEILPGNFFKRPLKVTLANVRFNRFGIAIAGRAEAKPRNSLAIPPGWKGNSGPLGLPEDPAQTLRSLSANSEEVSAVSQEAEELPLQFGGVHITNLTLTPTGAQAILVNLQKLSGDREQGDKFALFAKRRVCFSAGGPAVPPEEAYLPLVNEVTVDRSDTYSITLLRTASDAPYGGTALPYGCQAAVPEISMAGYVTIQPGGFSQNGQPLSANPLYASFRATYTNWLDWEADLHLRTSATRMTCCNDATAATLTFEELPDYQLEVASLLLDHSSATNPEGLQLPAGSNSPDAELIARFPSFGNIWNGLYLKEAKWQLPAFVSKANGERIEFRAQHAVFDDAGFSTQSAFATDEFGLQVNVRDWTGRVQGSSVDIRANELAETTLSLSVRVPVFEDDIPVIGEASWTGSRLDWAFSLPDIQGLERRIPAWSASLTLARYGSSMSAFLNNDRDELALTLSLWGALDFDNEIGDVGGVNLKGIDVQNLFVNNWNTTWNQRNPIVVGAFRTSPRKIYTIGGYRAFIDRIRTEFIAAGDMTTDASRLTIDYDFSFDQLASMGQSGITSSGQLNIDTEAVGLPFTRVQRRRTWLKPVQIDWAPMEGIAADGIVSYQQTPNGRMFKGSFDLEVLGYDARITAHLGATHGHPFWAFAGEVPFPRPIPVFLGLSTHSFGGGIYYNMVKPQLPDRGASVTEVNFSPPGPGRNIGNYGIMFSTVLLDEASSGSAFNGRFLLELDMRRLGLEQIRLSGEAHLLDKDIPTNYWVTHTEPDPDAAFTVDASIRFNWPERTFDAEAGYRINFEDGLVTGGGEDLVDILVNSSRWHVHLGHKNNRLNAQLNLLSDPIDLNAYFMIEGSTNDWSSALESLEFGFRGNYETSTSAYRVPGTVADRIKFSGHVNFDLEGGFGNNVTFCSNHPAGDFFAYLSAAASLGFSVEYYESKRSIWPWLVVNRKWNRWERWFSWGISGNIAMYMPNPTGINLGLTVDIPYWGNERFNLQLGSRCQ